MTTLDSDSLTGILPGGGWRKLRTYRPRYEPVEAIQVHQTSVSEVMAALKQRGFRAKAHISVEDKKTDNFYVEIEGKGENLCAWENDWFVFDVGKYGVARFRPDDFQKTWEQWPK